MTVIKDPIAYDKKLRRGMRAKARRNGDPMGLLDNNQGGKVDNLLTTYNRAKDHNILIQALNAADTQEARKLKKKLQNHWYNRGDKGKVNPKGSLIEASQAVRGKEKQRGKSIPLINSF